MTITRFSTGAIRDNALATNVSFAASDMELIGTVRLNSNTSSVTFSNIPQEYKHLQIRGISQQNTFSSVANIYVLLRFNGSSATNYTSHVLSGDGSGVGSAVIGTNQSNIYVAEQIIVNAASNIFGAFVTDILDYSNPSKNTTTRSLDGWDRNGGGLVCLHSGVWLSKDAVNSLTLLPNLSYSLSANTRFSLYGIRG